ncbi:GH3 auxin-responsive promoter family protein [Oceanihabitans sp.]|nr:GH3 auxin-responsive promoter family protein [Oceanihabitans sp.]
MKMIKYLLILLIVISITSCKIEDKETNKFKVEYSGALKNMMHKGDVSAKVGLKEFENNAHFYALGAIENLKGEIQIFNSKPFNTMVIDSALSFDNTFDKKATLLVYASINKWKSFNIPENIVTYKDLENYIEQTAKENLITIDEPFPFLLEGKPKLIDWHVINWKDGDMEHSHEKHVKSGLNGTLNNMLVEMLGFYSDSHHAIFTHHTTNMHIHVKTVDNKLAGHVDGLTLEKGMILKLPYIK